MIAPYGGVLAAAHAARRGEAGPGLAVMMVAALPGEGVSTAARAAAEEARAPVLLIELDAKRNTHARHYAGKLGAALDARANGASFYRVKDANGLLLREQAITRRPVTGSLLQVTAFDLEACPANARVQISGDSAYWEGVRAMGVTALVDAPALSRSPLALKVAKHMDAVVLVVSGDAGAAPPAMEARAALTEAGANVIGIVFSRASAPVMAIDRLSRRFG